MNPPAVPRTLLLARSEIANCLPLAACIDAVEQAFAQHHDGKTLAPAVLGLHATGGGFHVKAAGLARARDYVAVKINANFPDNPRLRGLPTIQGIVALYDGRTGTPLALMDAAEITGLRTAAATAAAARRLARADSRVVAMIGCGAQAAAQLRALALVLPLDTIVVHDCDAAKAEALAAAAAPALGVRVAIARSVAEALDGADVCVTCTTARRPILRAEDVRPGVFVAAVGADNPEKQEIDPALFARATVVVDLLEQCAEIGDLHHALAAGVVTRAAVHAELGAVIAGTKRGRVSAGEITLFDSTGTGLQDVAAAALAYERALAAGAGVSIALGA